MDPVVWLTMAEVLVFVFGAWALTVWIAKRRGGPEGSRRRYDMGDALGFIGGALGILLGLLLVFAVEHFAHARDIARQEALHASALYDAFGVFPADEAAEGRRTIFCTIESLRTDDWQAAIAGDATGSTATSAWLGSLQHQIATLDQGSDGQMSIHYFVNENYLDLSKGRQERLLLALPEIPATIWWVLAVSTMIFIALLALHMGPMRRVTLVSVAAAGVMLAVAGGALAHLDYPFRGRLGVLSPLALESAVVTIQEKYPSGDFSPCPATPPVQPTATAAAGTGP